MNRNEWTFQTHGCLRFADGGKSHPTTNIKIGDKATKQGPVVFYALQYLIKEFLARLYVRSSIFEA